MAKRIYVGGLPYSATEEDLENLFSSAGAVKEVTIITDKYTGQAKGFGFVEMDDDQEAMDGDQSTQRHPNGRSNPDSQRSQTT